jgi:hypothetical protein
MPKAKKREESTVEQGVDAIELLKSQHREVEDLFAKIEAIGDRAAKTRAALFEELAVKIEAHAEIEEQRFYPEGRSVDKDMTLEAYEEHGVVRDVIEKIKAVEPTDETFMAKVTVLKEMIEHHVEEEEGEFFPKLRKALGKERLMDLGAAMEEQFDAYVDEQLPSDGALPRKSAQKNGASEARA